jgi:prepilin-type N-terminal cleavage/methylation domain-containing protein/prepilin-type processing-associated H-X9-DG protein
MRAPYFQCAKCRAAMTLVELLVVVAIIGMLIALLLPAVQAAREASRRAQCQNNLRQLAVAAALHANAHGSFPIGCIGGRTSPDKRFISWNVQLLPFLELSDAARLFDIQLPSYDPANKTVREIVVDAFLCPSTDKDERFSTSVAWEGAAFTDYGGIYGVEGVGRDRADEDAPSRQTLANGSLGAMLYDEAVAPKQITDGLAKTALVAETKSRRLSDVTEWVNGLNVFAQEQSTPINGDGLDNEVGSPHPDGASLAFSDGHVQFIAETSEQQVLIAMLTKAGGD